MVLEFAHTFDDYREANNAVIRSRKGRWLTRFGMSVLLLMLAALLVVMFVVTIANHETGRSFVPELKREWVMLAAAAYMSFVALTAHGRALRRGWRLQPNLQLGRRVTIGDECIVVNDAQVRAEYKWSALQRYVESVNLFVLLPSEMILVMIPKRAFAGPADVDQFRALLDERVVRPAVPGFPVATAAANND
jgi:hypothetical protein